jgi:hypothetical protein
MLLIRHRPHGRRDKGDADDANRKGTHDD